jgi:hypothetical protein
MRSLGTLRGALSASAFSVNTHQWIVGSSIFVEDEAFLPFIWTPGRGMRQLPTLGGDNGQANDLNEFGQIAGVDVTAQGEIRAALWTPTGGPAAAAAEAAAPSGEAR